MRIKIKELMVVLPLIVTVACSNLNNSYNQVQQDYKIYQEVSNEYNIEKEWWKDYQNAELNSIVDYALKNNSDMKKAAINVNKALYQANLVGADLVPKFSADLSSSASDLYPVKYSI